MSMALYGLYHKEGDFVPVQVNNYNLHINLCPAWAQQDDGHTEVAL